ncbi:class I SAM-dependent methyltransferase [Sphingomonas sp. HITSZ_GF]|uniref:O-methyltransferase n=1 Tax=Sphingomonas sp. HITSZ_GF TaxID=3037247 RepID=UPI00240E2CEB|nr:class I SAM-dependent methyltransferase [Sphingomonas sp. HITSZ_GF]MDG2532266.1 class I SAM-dependent methyltransferase [Sphingomonas sp. HITSZ_GF]
MTTLTDGPVARLLATLHDEATATDEAHFRAMMDKVEAQDGNIDALVETILAEERADLGAVYREYASNFLAVSPVFGRFLYAIARARGATRIVEFGTSMGVSAIYLAAAIRDNGGGRLIGSEIEPAKAARARAHLEAAGLADLVEIRVGDARETLADPGGTVDLMLVDGAFSLYLPVLRLIEPFLRPGAVILGENAFDPAYLDYVRNPANGYVSQPLPVDEGRGNEFTVRTL